MPKSKFDHIDHKNIDPRTHLNKTRLHLNRNVKIGTNFVNSVSNH